MIVPKHTSEVTVNPGGRHHTGGYLKGGNSVTPLHSPSKDEEKEYTTRAHNNDGFGSLNEAVETTPIL